MEEFRVSCTAAQYLIGAHYYTVACLNLHACAMVNIDFNVTVAPQSIYEPTIIAFFHRFAEQGECTRQDAC